MQAGAQAEKRGEKSACKLEPSKSKKNEDNAYNQNFRGVYCICHRPYPDPEDPVPDEMIQCVVCEDWFHGRHLGRAEEDCKADGGELVAPGFKVPGDSAYAEMVCVGCVKRHPFLMAYEGQAVDVVDKGGKGGGGEVSTSVNVESSDESAAPEAKRIKLDEPKEDSSKEQDKAGKLGIWT